MLLSWWRMRALFHMGAGLEIWPGKPLVYCPPNWSEERPMSHTVNTPPHVHPSIHVRIHRSENKSSPALSRMYVCDIHWVSWVKKQTLWGGVSIVGHANRCEGRQHRPLGSRGPRGGGLGSWGWGPGSRGWPGKPLKGLAHLRIVVRGLARLRMVVDRKGTGSSKDGSGP